MIQFVNDAGEVIEEGDILIDSRGNKWAFIQVVEKKKVYVKLVENADGTPLSNDKVTRIFFPSVFDLYPEEL